MDYGYGYGDYQPPTETYKQWCKRGAITKSDKARVMAAGWFIIVTVAYSIAYCVYLSIDIAKNGYNSSLFAPYKDIYLQAGIPESAFVSMFLGIVLFVSIVGLLLSVVMGIFILNYSFGWAVTYLVFESIGIFSSLTSVVLLVTIAYLPVFSINSIQLIFTIISIVFNIVGFVLSILAVSSLSRAKKQWQAQVQAQMQAYMQAQMQNRMQVYANYPEQPYYPVQPPC